MFQLFRAPYYYYYFIFMNEMNDLPRTLFPPGNRMWKVHCIPKEIHGCSRDLRASQKTLPYYRS